jgi:hypothetical protein
MESRLKGQAVPVSDNPDGDVRLNVQESAEAIVLRPAEEGLNRSYGKDYYDTEERSRIEGQA